MFRLLPLLLAFHLLSCRFSSALDLPFTPEELPPGLTALQLQEIEAARAVMAHAVSNPVTASEESLSVDAEGNLVEAASGLPLEQAKLLREAYATDLVMAAMSGNMEVLQASLENGAPLDTVDSHGRAPLALAAMNGRLDMVKELLRLGAPRGAKDANGHTALQLASLLQAESTEEGDLLRAHRLALVEEVLLTFKEPTAHAS
jgi:hypothetical protein